MFLLLLSSISLVFLVLVCIFDTIKPRNYPPGPKWFPVVGNYMEFRRRHGKLGYHHLVWAELAKEYGPVVGLRLGRRMVVSVSGVAAVKEVLTRDEFDGRPDGFFFRLRTFGKRLGIVFSDGQHWQKQRKFSLQHLRNFGLGKREMELRIIEESKELVENLRRNCGNPIFMHNVFDVSVLNILWTMLAGERFELDDARLLKLLQIIHDAFRVIDMSGGLLNQMPFLRHIAPNMCGYTQVVERLTRLRAFFEETISQHRKTICSSDARDLIDAFLHKMNVKDCTDTTFTDEQLLSLCLDLFMAGSETTSNTLSFAVLYMLEYPDVQKKVQKELDEVVGRNRWPTMQDKVNLPYTEAVLMEIQRRANVPPLGVAHRATKDANLLGWRIPKGTTVLTSLYSVHMEEDFWKDPAEFRPERFLNEQGRVAAPEWHFVPFGHGKRRCLGESLAKTNYFLFFTALFHNFSAGKEAGTIRLSMDGFDGVTISPKPFKAMLVPRND